MKLHSWWRERPAREKLLLTGAAVAMLLLVGDALLTQPMAKRLARTEAKNRQQQEHLAAQAKREAKSGPSAVDTQPDQEAALRERLERLRREVAERRERLADTTRLPETLRAITATVGSTRLLELDLAGVAEGPAAVAAAAGKPGLHRLPITLKVAGSWQELQLLLGQIERHAPTLQWSALTLDSAEWPSIQLTLKAHVLSSAPRWGAGSR